MISEAPWVELPVELNAANLFLLHRKLQTINPYVPSVRAGAKPKERAATQKARDEAMLVRAAVTRASLLVQNLHKGHLDILSINVLQLLPADAAEELASTILAWCGWLLELMDRAGARRPYALTWRQAPSVDDGKPPLLGVGRVLISCLESCRKCAAAKSVWPAQWPEFCSAACGMLWTKENAQKIERAERIDDELAEAIETGHDTGVEAAKEEAQEEARELKYEWLNGEDNTLLDVLRSHFGDRTLDLETATWRLTYDILPKLAKP